MAQVVGPRPSFVAALRAWRSTTVLFCHQRRSLSFLQPSSSPRVSISSPTGRRNFSIRRMADMKASPLIRSMETKIKEQLPAELVTVNDAYGDGRHVSINVISRAFEGQSAMNRQRMVYKAIWEELQSAVHAVDQMTTWTPAEAEAAGEEAT